LDNATKEKCSVRLARALAIRGMKQSELCEKTKIPKSAISQYLSGSFEPKQDRLHVIAQALNVDPVWLMGFDVPMEKVNETSPSELQLTEGDKMILEVFRLIPEEQQRAFLEMGRAYANSLKKD
jgi:transcriptional regulator with XRE-family HTH domain